MARGRREYEVRVHKIRDLMAGTHAWFGGSRSLSCSGGSGQAILRLPRCDLARSRIGARDSRVR